MKSWYSLGTYENIKCSNCSVQQNNVQALDHHSMVCPKCQIKCIWYDLGKGKVLQVIPSLAPVEFRKFIQWSQKELDELEFTELIVSFEELAKAMKQGWCR